MRTPAPRNKPRTSKVKTFIAPNRGWIANENLAKASDGGAEVMENWFPLASGARMRAGSNLYATVASGSATTAGMVYSAGSVDRLFACTETDIFDITTVSDSAVIPTAAVSGLTGGDWVAEQFATAGGTFLRAVNGSDTPLVYDGTTWGTTPAITGVTDTTLSFVWAYQQRLFFVQDGTLDAWYLSVDAIGGAAVKLPLGGVFNRGGSLLFGATWSTDSGDGLTEQCVFITTEGEVAVYRGSDPSSAADWAKVGVYRIGRPLGKNAWIKAGGDLVIATDIGFVPLSQAIQRDVAALAPAAVSYPIETAWNEAVSQRPTDGWDCEVWPTRQMVLVTLPEASGYENAMFIANARTGAWAKFTGWSGTWLRLFRDRMFFGTSIGTVIEAEVGGYDLGEPYVCSLVPRFDDIKTPASLKVSKLARAVLLATAEPNDRLSVQTDYMIDLPSPPDVAQPATGDVWDSGTWGTSLWGVAVSRQTFARWQSVNGSGTAIAPALQITSGSAAAPDVQLVRIDMTIDTGDVVT